MKILVFALLLVAPAFANRQARGWCEVGGQSTITSGISSTSKVQASYPRCTVNVYLVGTLTHAVIYSDNASTPTPLANAFTASAQGYWFFYAADGCYDITLSGGTPAFPAPFTIYDYCLNTGSGAGFTPPSGLQRQYLEITPNVLPQPSYRFNYLPYLDMHDFDFPAQALPNISPGNNLITLAPVPLGVNWFDLNHFLYVVGGSGTPEACQIVSAGPGTAVAGTASGTLTINCANVHTGAVVSTATAGLAEAWRTGLNVHAAPGTYNFYASVTPPTSGSLQCDGNATTDRVSANIGQVVLLYNPTTGDMFHVIRDGFFISGCLLRQVGTAVSSAGIATYGNLSTAPVHAADVMNVSYVSATGFYNGFRTDGGTSLAEWVADWSIGSVSDGFSWGDTQGHLISCVSEFSQTGNGITFHLPTSGNEEPVPWLEGFQAFSNFGWGVYANEASFHFSGMVNYFGNDRLGEIYYNYHFSSLCDNCTFAESGKPGSVGQFPINTTAPGVFVDSNGAGLVLNNVLFGGTEGTCFKSIGVYNRMANAEFLGGQDGCGVGGVVGNIYSIDASGTAPNGGQLDQIINSRMANPVRLAGDGKQFTHNVISMNETDVPLVRITRGLQIDFAENYLFNAAGGGIAFQCDSGVTLSDSSNVIGQGGTVLNCNGQANVNGVFVPRALKHSLVSDLPNPSANAFTEMLATDGTPGTSPAVGGAVGPNAGCIVFSDGSIWHCGGTSGGGGGGVVTFNGRTGTVVSVTGDYNSLQITGARYTPTFSATPTFDLSQGTVQTLVLTGNVTGAIFINIIPNLTYDFWICQDAIGSRGFAWPASVHAPMNVGLVANKCSNQTFLATDASNLYGKPGIINQ